MLTIDEASRRLGCDSKQLLARLIRDRFIYRYTGVGRPLAYAQWVRAGLFVNAATGVSITQSGLEVVEGTPKIP